MNAFFRKHLALVGLCLLMLIMLPNSAFTQDGVPPLPPTPEPDGAIPEAPEPDINEVFIQELSAESLPADFSLMAGGITQRVADINPGGGSSYPQFLKVFKSKLYFNANGDDGAGYELWAYDGSSASLEKDIYSGINGSNPSWLQVFDNRLYFAANGGDGAGHELWAYNGLDVPYRVADINPGPPHSFAQHLQVFKNKLYFQADSGDGKGAELWVYDGSASLVKDIKPGDGSYPAFLQVFNNKLYFGADGGDGAGTELWAYDGSSPPYRAADINSGSNGSWPEYMQVFNNKLFFSANGGDGKGQELWAYDGSNTSRVADIHPGLGSSNPAYLQVLNNLLYFCAYGGDGAGTELWVYDGINIPYRITDIISGSGSSYPAYLQVFNNKLYFQADGGDGAGTELWVYIPTVTKTLPSSGAYDGWVLESARTSNRGGSLNRTATTLRVGDDDQNRQYRAILHFNTASLPDNAVITAVKLQVKRAGYKGTYPFNTHGALYVDLRKGAFSNNNALQTADWQAPASKSAAGKIPKTSTSNWHTLNLAAANFKYINKKGVSQLRLRFAKQDNGDNGADYVNFYSGNAAAANRPKLIITYYMP